MKTTRREFIGGATAFAPFAADLWAAEAETPLLKIGVMTDTHVGTTKESCARARLAYEMFRDMGVDLIANVGDVADHHYPTGYVAYREMVEETFAQVPAGRRPKELFVYAWHDAYAYKDHPREAAAKDSPEAFADMEKLIGATNGPYAEGEIKGYPYVVIPQLYGVQGVDWQRFDKMLADAVASHPGKPVFVFAHQPPTGTTRSGRGIPKKRAVLNKYPQAINISGHTHGSLRDERAIWQGEFTSVNIGCLQNWGGGLTGTAPTRMENYGAVLVEVFADRIVFRRFDVRDRREYSADAPWMVPWPFNPATAPYRPSARRPKMPVPQFAKDAGIEVKPDAVPFKNLLVTVPAASVGARAFAYRVELMRRVDGKWLPFARKDMFGDFWMRESERPTTVTQRINSAYFDDGSEYRVIVTPRNSWGVYGQPIEKTFAAPKPSRNGELVWESSDPMKDCPFISGLKGGKARKATDGFYEHGTGNARLEFPADVWKGKKGTRFRFTLDMRTIQEHAPCWTIVLRNPTPLRNAADRISTPEGDSGVQRYVIEFAKDNAAYWYYLLIREGTGGKVRFEHVRIERI
ncbi:MAG: metallophosphoesterase [Kiritimatiellae bacterium]|nr:metallophosphoesterase [Kiritimatiellia bacterium]